MAAKNNNEVPPVPVPPTGATPPPVPPIEPAPATKAAPKTSASAAAKAAPKAAPKTTTPKASSVPVPPPAPAAAAPVAGAVAAPATPPAPPAAAAPAYGAPGAPYTPPPAGPPQGLSIASMISGIAGLLLTFVALGFLPALAGVILGHIAQKRQPYAKPFWLTGIITGYVGVGISLIGLVFVILAFLIAASSASYFG